MQFLQHEICLTILSSKNGTLRLPTIKNCPFTLISSRSVWKTYPSSALFSRCCRQAQSDRYRHQSGGSTTGRALNFLITRQKITSYILRISMISNLTFSSHLHPGRMPSVIEIRFWEWISVYFHGWGEHFGIINEDKLLLCNFLMD